MPQSCDTIFLSHVCGESASEGATLMSGIGANRDLHAGKGFAVEEDSGVQRLRVAVLEGVDSSSLEQESNVELIRFGDLAALSDPPKKLTILFVDLEALDAKKRTQLIAHIGRVNTVRAIAFEEGMGAGICEQLLRTGFAGVLHRDCSRETLLRAIASVGDGQLWFPREIISRVLRGFLIEEELNRLTSRETEIVRLIGNGMNNQQIADKLFISRETVRWHVRGLHAKLGTKDRHSLKEYVRYLHSGEQKIPSTSVGAGRRSIAS